ncbi:rod shape-determining protein RodA [Ancylomarina salipaludis]|uniref:Cell wall polymerase n=1 Tax=Ancylomarina salipaludis TaxID=2501299 RepID=A0A4Q1JIC1_9BACT|nr:rod shape-determining protein RodA [Ancylomarina salipaludis]RXQ88800.1 rod shape-determining protein RodA [Ancylomarina salipaludis]
MNRKVSLIKNLDWMTIMLYAILVFLGWINIYAAVYNEDHQSIFDATQRYGKQLMWIGAAIFIAIIILTIESKFYSAFAYPTLILMILLLLAVLTFGVKVNGARSWFELGAIRFQPAEFAKFATNLAIARYLSQHNFKIHRLKSLAVTGLILFTPAVLILMQNDTGSALVYSVFILVLYREGLSGFVLFLALLAAIFFVFTLIYSSFTVSILILIIAAISLKTIGIQTKQIAIATAMLAGSFGTLWLINKGTNFQLGNFSLVVISILLNTIPFLIYTYRQKIKKAALVLLLVIGSLFYTFSVSYIFDTVLESHQQQRINELLGIKSDPYGTGYNVNQSKIAIGSGGFNGKGFLNGTQTKFNFVPEQSTDFIFCTVGEEWGFLGSALVLLLHLSLILRLIYLSERQRSSFSRIYGYGVAAILFFHVAVNVGMTIGLAPVIGIPLPFFSYGGSSLWSFTILLFIFLRLDANRLELLR